MKQKNTHASYLDVSEFVLKEHSPLFKPRTIDQPIELLQHRGTFSVEQSPMLATISFIFFYFYIQLNRPAYELSPNASPIFDNKINFAMTPLFEKGKLDPFRDANLDELDNFTLDVTIIEHKGKRSKRNRPRLPSSYYILENELQDIIEQHDSECLEQNYSESGSQSPHSEESHNQYDNEQQNESQGQQVQNENEKLSNTLFECSNYEFKSVEWQSPNPKKQLIAKLKAIVSNTEIKSQQQKIVNIKQTFCKYLCEHEKYYFQESVNALHKQNETAAQLTEVLIKGIQQTFKREIHGLSFEKRRVKLLRYLDKKKRRVWRKKVSYDCRKKVADGRLRIKGKFVTYQQACEQLGLASMQGYTPDDIKEMLYKKLEHS